jgi:uncharacterized protein YutE (UPF0331/DUF86 family)
MLERLQNLEENIAALKTMRETWTPETIRANRFDEWALRYGLFESIRIVIDIACHIAGKYNLGPSDTYAECIEKLVDHNYLDEALGRRLVAAIGLRNLLIHEYARIDSRRLFGFLDATDDFARFIERIAPYV